MIAGKDTGSLADFGISFEKADLKDGAFDYHAIENGLRNPKVKVVFIQRSRGLRMARRAIAGKNLGGVRVREKMRLSRLYFRG